MSRGFTLVEILVALVILQVGLLGVVGTLVLAARVLNQARDLEVAVAALEAVYDSLRLADGTEGRGEARLGPGILSWSAGADGALGLRYVVGGEVVGEVFGGAEVRP